MVNKLHKMKTRVVKVEKARENDPQVTAKAGLSLAQGLASRMRLFSDARKELPSRKDPKQGYETTAVIGSLVHGLLSEGRGFSATEPMRGDKPLLKMLGLERAPSAETVEEVVKYLALESEGKEALTRLNHRFVSRLINASKRSDLYSCGGFVPVWADGSLLEVYGKKFDSIKKKKSMRGQMSVGTFVGPWLTEVDFAKEGEGEETLGRRMLKETISKVLRPNKLVKDTLILLDSLYGDGPTFDRLEGIRGKPSFRVGVQTLKQASQIMNDLPEAVWRDTGRDLSRGWEESGVTQAWLYCADWKHKRTMICRRWKNEGEMFCNFAGVVTDLTAEDPRVKELIKRHNTSFEEVIWWLYSHKQGMENQWKDLLIDMGLHHPPCAKAIVNAVFYAVAGLAYNLSVGVRRLTLSDVSCKMRLWRLRREVFDLAGYVVHHGRKVVMRILDARDHLIEQILQAMYRLARL